MRSEDRIGFSPMSPPALSQLDREHKVGGRSVPNIRTQSAAVTNRHVQCPTELATCVRNKIVLRKPRHHESCDCLACVLLVTPSAMSTNASARLDDVSVLLCTVV